MECDPPILDESLSTAPHQLNIGAGPAAGGGGLGAASVGNSVLCEEGGTGDGEVWGEGVAGDVTLWGAAGDAEPWRGKPFIKQDLWHALHGVIAPAHVAHDGFGPLCLQLSKAFDLPNPELLEALMRVVRLRHPDWSELEVAQSLYGRYAAARQRHVPTMIPPPDELVVRF